MSPIVIAGMFAFAHCLLDYPLQGDFLSKAKNHRAPIPGVPWQWALASHATIQGGGVGVVTYLATGNADLAMLLAVAEALVHALTDWLKSDGRISFHIDQCMHLGAKISWVAICLGAGAASAG